MIDDTSVEEDDTETEAIEEESLTDTITKAFEAQGVDVPVEKDETSAEKAARIRDEKGRFTKAQEAAPEPQTKPVSDQTTGTVTPEAVTPPIMQHPVSWAAEKRDLYSKLPPEAQEYILQRDRETNQVISRKSQETEAAKRDAMAFQSIGQEFGDVFEPVKGDFKEGFRQLSQAQRTLDADPARSLEIMAKSYGYNVTLTPIAGAKVRQAVDPEIYKLRQTVSQLQQNWENEQKARISHLSEQSEAEVIAFQNETDQHGNLKHPFLEEVAPYILSRVDSAIIQYPNESRKAILEKLYDEGVWANPTTRAKQLQAQSSVSTNRDKVAKAERAASSVRGAPGAGMLSLKSDSLEDTIRAAFGM